MKRVNSRFFGLLLVMTLTSVIFTNCKEDEAFAEVLVNEIGDTFGGDVTGDGGSTQRSYTLNNPETTVDWNMDITSARGGSFDLRIADADGNNVLSQTIIKGQGDDTRSGVSNEGTAGEWTITITLSDFNGDGSFSITPGN